MEMVVEVYNIKDFKGGWFLGNFEPSIEKFSQFEIGIVKHHRGQKWDNHIHKVATEYNVILSGTLRMQGQLLHKGDIFVMKPYELSDSEFLEDCEILVIKVPSVPGDKYCFIPKES
jgi:quercetin dioxygenase-like cupin family protein